MALSKEYENCDINRIKELCQKFPKEYADLLQLTAPIMIDYFGKNFEGNILNTLSKVVIEESNEEKGIFLYDVINRHKPSNYVQNNDGVENSNLINMAAGVFQGWPEIEKKDGKYVLAGEKMVIGVHPFENNFLTISNFVHEFMHAVKSTTDEFSIVSDDHQNEYLRERCGLIQYLYSLKTNENGTIESQLIKKINKGLEEGINTVDEFAVLNRLLEIPIDKLPEDCRYIVERLPEKDREPNHKIEAGYRYLANTSKNLLDNPKMNNKIREAQFNGKYMGLQNFFNKEAGEKENSWQILNNNMDTVADKMYDFYRGRIGYDGDNFEKFKAGLKIDQASISKIVEKVLENKEKAENER